MWKGAAVFLLATLAIGWHLRYQAPLEVPTLPSKYWGPGNPVADPADIKPFKIDVPKEVIDDLNARLDRARLSTEPLESAAWTYGIPSTYMQGVVNYWRKRYDWSKRQALLNRYPQFTTRIQGLDIHFYHVKPELPKDRKVKVLPLLMLHGWPGSVVEFQKAIPLLTKPRADQDFVFELVVPSLPGYGFSKPAVRPGLGPAQMSVIFKNLMQRLGFETFYTQGGDWGSVITANIAALYPKNVLGSHLNMCSVESPKAHFLAFIGAYIPSLIIESEYQSRMYPLTEHYSWLMEETGYMHIQATKPDTVGTALNDSPVGLAAYILEKFSTWTDPANKLRDDGGLLDKYSIDELLDNIMVYWVTNSIVTSQRLYAECFNKAYRELGVDKIPIEVPTGCAMFPNELAYQPEVILRDRFVNLIHMTHPARGGHFAAFEEPQLFVDDVVAFVSKAELARKEARKAQMEQKKKAATGAKKA